MSQDFSLRPCNQYFNFKEEAEKAESSLSQFDDRSSDTITGSEVEDEIPEEPDFGGVVVMQEIITFNQDFRLSQMKQELYEEQGFGSEFLNHNAVEMNFENSIELMKNSNVHEESKEETIHSREGTIFSHNLIKVLKDEPLEEKSDENELLKKYEAHTDHERTSKIFCEEDSKILREIKEEAVIPKEYFRLSYIKQEPPDYQEEYEPQINEDELWSCENTSEFSKEESSSIFRENEEETMTFNQAIRISDILEQRLPEQQHHEELLREDVLKVDPEKTTELFQSMIYKIDEEEIFYPKELRMSQLTQVLAVEPSKEACLTENDLKVEIINDGVTAPVELYDEDQWITDVWAEGYGKVVAICMPDQCWNPCYAHLHLPTEGGNDETLKEIQDNGGRITDGWAMDCEEDSSDSVMSIEELNNEFVKKTFDLQADLKREKTLNIDYERIRSLVKENEKLQGTFIRNQEQKNQERKENNDIKNKNNSESKAREFKIVEGKPNRKSSSLRGQQEEATPKINDIINKNDKSMTSESKTEEVIDPEVVKLRVILEADEPEYTIEEFCRMMYGDSYAKEVYEKKPQQTIVNTTENKKVNLTSCDSKVQANRKEKSVHQENQQVKRKIFHTSEIKEVNLSPTSYDNKVEQYKLQIEKLKSQHSIDTTSEHVYRKSTATTSEYLNGKTATSTNDHVNWKSIVTTSQNVHEKSPATISEHVKNKSATNTIGLIGRKSATNTSKHINGESNAITSNHVKRKPAATTTEHVNIKFASTTSKNVNGRSDTNTSENVISKTDALTNECVNWKSKTTTIKQLNEKSPAISNECIYRESNTTYSEYVKEKFAATTIGNVNKKSTATTSEHVNGQSTDTTSKQINRVPATTTTGHVNRKHTATTSEHVNGKSTDTTSKKINGVPATTTTGHVNRKHTATASEHVNGKSSVSTSKGVNGESNATTSHHIKRKSDSTTSENVNRKVTATTSEEVNGTSVATTSEHINGESNYTNSQHVKNKYTSVTSETVKSASTISEHVDDKSATSTSEHVYRKPVATTIGHLNRKSAVTTSKYINRECNATTNQHVNRTPAATTSESVNGRMDSTTSENVNRKSATTTSENVKWKYNATTNKHVNEKPPATASEYITGEFITTTSENVKWKSIATTNEHENGEFCTTTSVHINVKSAATTSVHINMKSDVSRSIEKKENHEPTLLDREDPINDNEIINKKTDVTNWESRVEEILDRKLLSQSEKQRLEKYKVSIYENLNKRKNMPKNTGIPQNQKSTSLGKLDEKSKVIDNETANKNCNLSTTSVKEQTKQCTNQSYKVTEGNQLRAWQSSFEKYHGEDLSDISDEELSDDWEEGQLTQQMTPPGGYTKREPAHHARWRSSSSAPVAKSIGSTSWGGSCCTEEYYPTAKIEDDDYEEGQLTQQATPPGGYVKSETTSTYEVVDLTTEVDNEVESLRMFRRCRHKKHKKHHKKHGKRKKYKRSFSSSSMEFRNKKPKVYSDLDRNLGSLSTSWVTPQRENSLLIETNWTRSEEFFLRSPSFSPSPNRPESPENPFRSRSPRCRTPGFFERNNCYQRELEDYKSRREQHLSNEREMIITGKNCDLEVTDENKKDFTQKRPCGDSDHPFYLHSEEAEYYKDRFKRNGQPVQILHEICTRFKWGLPKYLILSTEGGFRFGLQLRGFLFRTKKTGQQKKIARAEAVKEVLKWMKVIGEEE